MLAVAERINNNILDIRDLDKSKLIPSYAYYILEYHECDYLKLGKSYYKKEDLKGKENWKDVKETSRKDI